MKTLKVNYSYEIPTNFTGIAEWANGTKLWYKNGLIHRLDGPAIEWSNGDKLWYVDGAYVTEEDFPKAVLDYKLKRVLES